MSIECSLDVTPDTDSVAFSLTVANTGDAPTDLSFSSAQTHDVTVTSGGSAVWRFSEGQMFAQMMNSETLDAGESLTFEAVWEDPDPGEYEATAELTARNVDCGDSARFSV